MENEAHLETESIWTVEEYKAWAKPNMTVAEMKALSNGRPIDPLNPPWDHPIALLESIRRWKAEGAPAWAWFN